MQSTRQQFFKGAIDMLPLSIAVIPWGILAGSMAIHAGLPWEKALAMSALVFAGAAQLLSLGLVIAGASTLSILVSVYFLTTQHLIYALTLRNHIAKQVWYVRMTQAFLLTDEQFALSASKQQYSMAYLFGAGLCFYLFWVVFSAVGIVFTRVIPDFQNYPLDFSVIAIFIPMILALISNLTTLMAVLVTIISSLLFKVLQINAGLLLSAALGMACAVCIEYWQGKRA